MSCVMNIIFYTLCGECLMIGHGHEQLNIECGHGIDHGQGLGVTQACS